MDRSEINKEKSIYLSPNKKLKKVIVKLKPDSYFEVQLIKGQLKIVKIEKEKVSDKEYDEIYNDLIKNVIYHAA